MNRRAALLFLANVVAILYLSLYPWHFVATRNAPGLEWVVNGTLRRVLLDELLNVGFYVPLGAAAFLVFTFPRRWFGVIAAIAVGALVSLSVEWMQLYLPDRFSSYVDLTTNTLGTAIGAAAALAWRSSHPVGWRPRHGQHLHITPIGMLLLGLWCLSQAFPFLPNLSLDRGEQTIHQLLAPTLVASEFALGFIALFVLGRAIEGAGWLAIAFAVVPAQALIVERSLSVSELVGAALGLLSTRLLLGRIPRRLTAAAFMAWLVVEELRPFQFGEPHRFYWIPFEGLMTGAPDTYSAVIFTKLFLYASAAWLVRRSGGAWAWAIAVPAIIIAVGEYLQQYLPGRTPETTDFVMLLASAVLVRITETAGQKHTASPGPRAS
jgi:VanZ family protein